MTEPSRSLAGRQALVTGATSGIGAARARVLDPAMIRYHGLLSAIAAENCLL